MGTKGKIIKLRHKMQNNKRGRGVNSSAGSRILRVLQNVAALGWRVAVHFETHPSGAPPHHPTPIGLLFSSFPSNRDTIHKKKKCRDKIFGAKKKKKKKKKS